MALSRWEELVQEKRERQRSSIPPEWIIPSVTRGLTNVLEVPSTCGLLSDKELEITGTSDASIILDKLATGQWSSVEVTTAFAKRAIIAHQLTNCLTEIFIDKALDRARELDEYLKQHGKVIGPLHGLPVSLKDQFWIKGLEATMGYVDWIGKYATEDAAVVKGLLEQGAVLYVKTNVPQTLMWGETHNNIFGRTLNPFNTSTTPGGSSGGEGALLAMHGSVLGVGTDVGGSIRNPSHFNGIFGMKPTSHRIPTYGLANSLDGQESIATIAGPMSTSLSGIKVFMKSILDTKPWLKDPNTIGKPWDENAYQLSDHGEDKQLCFGVIWDDGIFKPHPPVIRALQTIKQALEKAGHKVIDWVPYKHSELCANARSIFLSDGGADYQAALTSGEPMINSMKIDADPSDIPLFRRPREPLSAYQLWQLHKERRELRKEYFDRWQSTASITGTGRPVDAILAPVSPYAAVPHGEKRGAVYTIIWNTLDCPALVIPVTTVDADRDVKQPPHEFRSPDDKAIYDLYEPSTFDGLPVGVQLVGYRHEEEATIGMGEIVVKALSDI
ncbi:general amidase [Abortiporus biennis]|nr:general amidase [Abortiporus biennis]